MRLDPSTAAVVFERVSLAFDDAVVLRDVSFEMAGGRLTVLLGASGSGKTVVLRLILGLMKPDAGVITVNGERIDTMTEAELARVRGDIGMVFQESALFDSLTVAENVGYRLSEEIHMSIDKVDTRVEEVLRFVGLEEYLDRMPSELSGGQRRRVAIARAMASKPRLLLCDDSTTGLDPITAKTVMNEIIKLRDLEQVTPVLVTQQIPDAFYVADRQAVRMNGNVQVVPLADGRASEADFIVLKDGGVFFDGTAEDLRGSNDPYLKSFLTGWIPSLV